QSSLIEKRPSSAASTNLARSAMGWVCFQGMAFSKGETYHEQCVDCYRCARSKVLPICPVCTRGEAHMEPLSGILGGMRHRGLRPRFVLPKLGSPNVCRETPATSVSRFRRAF